METKECSFSGFKMNGFLALFLHLVVLTAVIIFGFLISVPTLILSVCLCLVWFIMFAGYMELEPNEARAMVFFGKYKGTFKETGFFWVNPFLNKKKLSLIGLVLVWKLKDTYKAMFEIDSQTMAASAPTAGNANQVSLGNAVANRMNAFENFVMIQSDAALRQVAGQYAYDDNEADTEELTLRSGGEEINEQLEQKLNERLAMAGMEVVEARINYLAYAPEIAAVMLRRQQASAIITAREKIVEGAVSMVKMALHKLSEEEIVELDEDKKAAMVSNLLVVLCADEAAQPVVNTGTLNH